MEDDQQRSSLKTASAEPKMEGDDPQEFSEDKHIDEGV